MAINNNFPIDMVFDRKLNEEQVELIKREYQKTLSIGKMKMDSISYQLYLDKNNDVYLPKGSLIHGSESSIQNLINISKFGLLAEEFTGNIKKDGTYYTLKCKKINCDMLLSNYDNEFNIDEEYPFNTRNKRLAFIINPTSKLGGLLYYDILDDKFNNNAMVREIISNDVRTKLKEDGDSSLILGGIPSNCISGIVLGDDAILDTSLVDKIKTLFPNAYLISRGGAIIRDRSNVIKIDDYEDMSLAYSMEKVKNEILESENNKLKDEIKRIINSLKDNTSNIEQALIYKSLGYKIPKGLQSKLTVEESKKLK